MGEALLIKSNAYKINTPLDDVDIMAGYCAILAIVRDSGGNLIPNIPVNCYDNGVWYNNTTNTLGMALFYTNSGNVNLITRNYSIVENFNMIDQIPPDPIIIRQDNGTKVMANFNFIRVANNTKFVYTRNSSRNMRFMDTNNAWIQVVGGGGGASYNCGGGGGEYEGKYINPSRSNYYRITIGAGGFAKPSGGDTGGTTSAFGVSAIGGSGGSATAGGNGGGSGSNKGGNGGNRFSNGTPSTYANANFNYGGGGGGIGRAQEDLSRPYKIDRKRIDGTWYYNIQVYTDSSLEKMAYWPLVTASYYGFNGGGRSAIVNEGPNRYGNFYFNHPVYGNSCDFDDYNGIAPPASAGENGANGGGGGAAAYGSPSYYYDNPGYGGDGICIVTIIE